MAEFFEVMKQARRMCRSNSCDTCTLPELYEEMCVWNSKPLEFTNKIIAEIESKTLQWAAEHPEHPESRYPTWREWQQEHFRDGANMIRPCEFMSRADAHCFDYIDTHGCRDCANQHIPADIAEKLGIKPKEA